MFRMQTLFATCPSGGDIEYRVDVALRNVSPDHAVRVTRPDGQSEHLVPAADAVGFEQRHGEGVWRFVVELIDKNDETTCWDSLVVETIIVAETDEATRRAVAEAIAKMKPTHSGSSWSSNVDVRAEANALYDNLRGLEIPEVVRLLFVDRAKDHTTHWRRVLLLGQSIRRPEAKPYVPILFALAAYLLATQREMVIAGAEFDMLVNLPLLPQQKWMYFLALFAQVPADASLVNRNALHEIVEQLVRTTPPEYRGLVLRTAEERIDLDARVVNSLGSLYKRYDFRDGVARLLDAMEHEPVVTQTVCDLLKTWDLREHADRLRAMLPVLDLGRPGGPQIAQLLCAWMDVQTLPIILEKLETEYNPSTIRTAIGWLRSFAGAELVAKLEALANRSPPDKAKEILTSIKNTRELAPFKTPDV